MPSTASLPVAADPPKGSDAYFAECFVVKQIEADRASLARPYTQNRPIEPRTLSCTLKALHGPSDASQQGFSVYKTYTLKKTT